LANKPSTDFATYKEIMAELLLPISAKGLDDDTLKRLYESKLVYLENLREKCFWELNTCLESHFSTPDYILILDAIKNTRSHVKNIILMAITDGLAKRKVS